MYKVFITNQNKLAEVLNISPQHLSDIKSGRRGGSPEVMDRLEEVTGINKVIWLSPTQVKTLKRSLKSFFARQKEDESIFIKGSKMYR